jgi:hypothetical protein
MNDEGPAFAGPSFLRRTGLWLMGHGRVRPEGGLAAREATRG